MWFTRMYFLVVSFGMFIALTELSIKASQPPAAQDSKKIVLPSLTDKSIVIQSAVSPTQPVTAAQTASTPQTVSPQSSHIRMAASTTQSTTTAATATSPDSTAPVAGTAPTTETPKPSVVPSGSAASVAQPEATPATHPVSVTTSLTPPGAANTETVPASQTPQTVPADATYSAPVLSPGVSQQTNARTESVQPQAQPMPSAAPITSSEPTPARQEKPAAMPPAPTQPKTEQEEALGEDATIIGIDTVELQEAQGNWLFKRLWWERAEDKYEKIIKQVSAIMESRGQFFEKRTNAEKNIFDNLYQQIGFERGELEELINWLIDRMNKLREKEGMLDEKEREFYAQLQTEKQSLETIKSNVNAIMVLENSIDDVLSTLMETINRVHEYEQDAWQNFKDIARVLDDRKAKEMFYKIDAIWRNVTSLKEYVQMRLSGHFDQLLAKAKEESDRVSKSLQELKEKGLDLKKQEEAILQYDRDKEAARIREIEKAKLEEQEAEKRAEEEQQGYFTRYVWNPIKKVIMWPYYALFGENGEDEENEESSPTEGHMKQPAQQRTAQANTPRSEKRAPIKVEESDQEKGFLEAYIIDPLEKVWRFVVYIITWPYYAIVGQPEASQEEETQSTAPAAQHQEPAALPAKPAESTQENQQQSQVPLTQQPALNVQEPTHEQQPAEIPSQSVSVETQPQPVQEQMAPANIPASVTTEMAPAS